MSKQLPDPRLTRVFRLEATLGQPLDVGETTHGHRRIVPLTGGTFTGPELNGKLLPGASADWQVVLPDGTALGDIRYTLETDGADLLYVQSRGVRHGSAGYDGGGPLAGAHELHAEGPDEPVTSVHRGAHDDSVRLHLVGDAGNSVDGSPWRTSNVAVMPW
jgi:Protein of unknown function (DUF3237)